MSSPRVGPGGVRSTVQTRPSPETPVAPRTDVPAPATPAGWVARGGSRPHAPASPSVGSAAPASEVSAVATAAAGAVKPSDVLKLVKNGDVDVAIPVKAGELIPGKLKAKDDTVMRMTLRVKDGNIDFANSKLKFDPPLSGPMGVGLEGVNMTADGRMEVEASWLPNPVVGRAASSKLSEFVESVSSGQSLPVSLLGVQVGELGGKPDGRAASSSGPAASSGAEAPAGASPTKRSADDTDKLKKHIDLAKTAISVKNVQFLDSTVPLGAAGKIRLGADSKVELKGSLTDLQMTGRVSVQELGVDVGGTKVQGGRGSADVSMRWKSDAQLDGRLEGAISNFSLQAESAVSRRENGDFLELARGRIENGSLSFSQEIKDGKPAGKPETRLEIGHFQGTIAGGQISVPDGDGTAQITLGKTAVSGHIEVSPQRVLVSGDVDLNARVTGLETRGDVELAVSQLSLTGKAKVQYDSMSGVKAEGALRAQATVTGGTVKQAGADARINSGSLDVTGKKFELGKGGELTIEGRANHVDLSFQGLNAGERGMSVRGGAGAIKGKGDVTLNNKTLTFDKGDLALSASLEDGKLALGDDVSLDIKAGTRLEAVLQQASFGSGTRLDLSRAKVSAALDGGTVRLPTGQSLEFRDGTKLELKLDRLHFPGTPGGIPEAQGSIELQARLGAGQLDLSRTTLPGVSFSHMEGVDQIFKLRMGRFAIERGGAFDVQDLTFGIEASIRRLGGQIR